MAVADPILPNQLAMAGDPPPTGPTGGGKLPFRLYGRPLAAPRPAQPVSPSQSAVRPVTPPQLARPVTPPQLRESADEAPLALFHGSMADNLVTLKAGTHIGTRQAAVDRMQRVMDQTDEQRFPGMAKVGEERPTIYPVKFNPKNVLEWGDGMWDPQVLGPHLYRQGVISAAERDEMMRSNDFTKVLRDKGYDAISYENEHEDPGSRSYILLDDLPLKR